MSPNFFKENPFPYLPASRRDLSFYSNLLQEYFQKKRQEVYDGSQNYFSNPVGLRKFIFTISNLRHFFRVELTPKASTLSICIFLFVIDGLSANTRHRKKRNRDAYRIYTFLREFLSKEDKKILLNAFVFSARENSIPLRSRNERHLMYRAMRQSQSRAFPGSIYCSPQDSRGSAPICFCMEWLDRYEEKIDGLLWRLTIKLYKMRCSVVHEASAPAFCHVEERPPDYGFWGMSVYSGFGDNRSAREEHYRFGTAISRNELEIMFRDALWRAYLSGYPGTIGSTG